MGKNLVDDFVLGESAIPPEEVSVPQERKSPPIDEITPEHDRYYMVDPARHLDPAHVDVEWDKLWTTLRATRDTELRETFPSHVVAGWIGHDDRVAERHYLQITDAHFEKAVQNPVQYSAVSPCMGSHEIERKIKKTRNARQCKKKQLPAKTRSCIKWAIQDLNL